MRRTGLSALLLTVVSLALVFGGVAVAASPSVDSLGIHRGRDVFYPDGNVGYHEMLDITVSDSDGVGDIAAVTVTDTEGGVHVIFPGGADDAEWTEQTAWSAYVHWWDGGDGGTATPPPPGVYSVTVTDLAGNSESLSADPVGPVPEISVGGLDPTPGAMVLESVPSFSWTSIPGANHEIRVNRVSDWHLLWDVLTGSASSVVYNFDGTALQTELTPGETYVWAVVAWWPDSSAQTDDRVYVQVAPHSNGYFTVYAPEPTITDVSICPGRDTDAPDWAKYHRRASVRVTDCDGAGDITSITIIDANGVDHVKTPGCGCWWQEDDYTITANFCQWDLLDPPGGDSYTVVVTDASANTDSLVTAVVPVASDVHPEPVSPVMDSVIYDTAPTFSWNAGLPDCSYSLHLKEEGTGGDIWGVDLGAPADPVIEVPYDGTLELNHSYFWRIDSWRGEDVRVSDPRVEIWTSQTTGGRFTVYGDWPEIPPALPGKIAYGVGMTVPPELDNVFWWWDGGTWGMDKTSIMGYNADPGARVWLGPIGAGDADWSPDGGALLYSVTGSNTLWIDLLDGSPPTQIPGILGGGSVQWAPDGERICYDHPDGNIRIANADGSGERVVSPQSSGADKAAWSPDGVWISYRPSWGFDETWLVHPDGTEAHCLRIAGIVGYPEYGSDSIQVFSHTWSPDAARLAVGFVARPPDVPCDSCLSEGWVHGIGIVSRDGGPITPIFVAPTGIGCCAGPMAYAWSPDGTSIVFSSGHHLADRPGRPGFEPEAELWMVNADGSGDPTRLTYDHSSHGPVSWWAPNTHSGLSQSLTIGNVTLTYEEVVAEGSTSIVVTDELPSPPPGDLTFVDYFTYHLATTATVSGTVTVTVDYGETAYPPVLGERLSLLLWDGAQWVDITTVIDTAGYAITGAFPSGGASDWYVALALDRPGVPEVKVMFEACTEGLPIGPGLFVANADLTEPVRLTLPSRPPDWFCGQVGAVWSPDGTKVALAAPRTGEPWVLQILDLQQMLRSPDQAAEVLTDEMDQPVEGGMSAWSPSGDRLVYERWPRDGGGASIRVVNADGTGAHEIGSTDGFSRYPDWSADGTRVVFEVATEIHRNSHLYTLESMDDPGGPALRRLGFDDSLSEEAPHWSPDGTRVAFTRFPTGGQGKGPGSEIWVMDVDTGFERQLTDSPELGKCATSWCPYDGYIYYLCGPESQLRRVLPDGTDDQLVNGDISPLLWTLERVSWMPTGVWIDGINALPGESVAAKMGIADAENLAGVQAKVRYTGGSDTLTFDSILKGESILDWAMPSPVIGADVASFLGYAADPETQAVSGDHFLFNLNVTNSATAQPGDLQLLTFDDLKLSDDWGDPVDRVSFDGGVHTIPFAYLEVSSITGPVCADADDPLPFTVMLTAMDWDGLPMTDCDATVEFGTYGWSPYPWPATPVTPTTVALAGGSWSGEVTLSEPHPWQQVFAHWGDFAGYSNWFQAIGKGDASADNRITIFDVVKIANMAIERGEWADWQWWAGDVNGDDVVDIFDVVQAANAAMDAMQSMGIGRAGAPPVVAPPSEPVTVTTDVTESGDQVVVAVTLSDCAGLAGVQVELDYDTKKLAYSGVSAGDLLTGASSWSVMGNDLGGAVKSIAYTASAEVLAGGEGTILTFTFNQTGKGKAKVSVTSVELADVEGDEIATRAGAGKGVGKGRR